MKKVLSIMIALTLLLCVCSSFAFGGKMQTENRSVDTYQNKVSEELRSRLEEMDDDETIKVYIVLYDVDPDDVLAELSARYPEEYEEYIFAKEGDVTKDIFKEVSTSKDIDIDPKEAEYSDPVDGELLQRAIEHKREIYKEFYESWNGEFVGKYLKRDDVIFVSKYAPMIITELPKQDIVSLSNDSNCCYIDLYYEQKVDDLMLVANQTSEANTVRDTYGKKGSGVKIGQIESGVPDIDNPELTNAIISLYSSNATPHATEVAIAMVGSTRGIAPNASLYCIGVYSLSPGIYAPMELLIDYGVNIINMSWGIDNGGTYSMLDCWIDHIALNHDIHFVAAAGNSGAYVYSPGMAYNAITVGGYNTQNTVDTAANSNYSDDTICTFSSYWESTSSVTAEKPNLVAAASTYNCLLYDDPSVKGLDFGFEKNAGTSFAAPQVTGVIAQLCSQATALKTKQTAVGAILAAGSYKKVTGQYHLKKGDSFPGADSLSGSNNQISDLEGAGKLNAQGAWYIAWKGQYWGLGVSTNSFPYTKTIYINHNDNDYIRVGIFWLMRSMLSGSSHTSNSLGNYSMLGSFDNLNLTVKAPNGSVIASSTTVYSNYEIVQFAPTVSGYYTISIDLVSQTPMYGSGVTTTEPLGIAVW